MSGCDVWLNTPIRPHEASGTSGQKASLNGLPNCSIIDGWWEEGYNGKNGWAIGERRDYQDDETRDAADALALYETLEQSIVPLFFQRGDDGLPHEWIAVMKEAIRTVAPQFSMSRMVKEYVTKYYMPAARWRERMDARNYALARELTAWERHIRERWGEVSLSASGPTGEQISEDEPVHVEAMVRLGRLTPDDVRVELVTARDDNGSLADQRVVEMRPDGETVEGALRYRAEMDRFHTGSVVYGVRIGPYHTGLASPFELGLIRWA